MINIRQATTQADFDSIQGFYHQFANWLRQTYPEFAQILASTSLAQIEHEAASFPGIYAPPMGCLLLATYNDQQAGTVGLVDKGGKKCEMKRMFVDSQFRGKKIGHALARAIITEAKERGYETMELITGPRQHAAKALYQTLGFKIIRQGYSADGIPADLPEDLKSGAIWMELAL